ncbi:Uncharacterised protein [Klebsiella variicola]|uniref:Uncharacterized protein n=1 Tax=Klebsiella variicola TaxID=244366 RepID=A0ABD7PEI4_KLEVA|nr:Uncharacterised protein [Klebsiella variicola]
MPTLKPKRRQSSASKLTKQALLELAQDFPAECFAVPEPPSAILERTILSMQRRLQLQDRCIRDLSRAVTLLQQRAYSDSSNASTATKPDEDKE